MAPLTSEQIRKENEDQDSSSITSLKLTLRALSDVSCLKEFSNLEKLDLSCNNLSSLQGLGFCFNLKWLSVAQNKLESLQGIEELFKLTVLNAGQNMIKSMNHVTSLTNLRAVILNDNKISSICKVDNMTYLNTLVLSKNPIYNIGKSLENAKAITKISLSNCKIQDIGESLVSCIELKEARFANNEITTLPNQLSQNTRLLLLDLGKNAISKVSDLKVLSSLHNLRNLNLQGNHICEIYEKDMLTKKMRHLVPNLQIFNAKPMEKSYGIKRSKEEYISSTEKDINNAYAKDVVNNETEIKTKRKKSRVSNTEDGKENIFDEMLAKAPKRKKQSEADNKISSSINIVKSPFDAVDIEARKEGMKKKTKKYERNNTKEFDDGKSSFADIILSDNISELESTMAKQSMAFHKDNLQSGLVMNLGKKKKKKSQVTATGNVSVPIQATMQFGIGGPSAWDE